MTDFADTDISPDAATYASIAPMHRALSAQEAADYLGIPVTTLYTWRSRRKGFGPPAILMGKALRYRISDLEAWIESRLEVVEEVLPPKPRRSMTRARRSAPGLRQAG